MRDEKSRPSRDVILITGTAMVVFGLILLVEVAAGLLENGASLGTMALGFLLISMAWAEN